MMLLSFSFSFGTIGYIHYILIIDKQSCKKEDLLDRFVDFHPHILANNEFLSIKTTLVKRAQTFPIKNNYN